MMIAVGNEHMGNEQLSDELSVAATRATDAHKRLSRTPVDGPEYQKAMNAYLQATVLYMSIISVAQARQYEMLSAEVTELREIVAESDHLTQVH